MSLEPNYSPQALEALTALEGGTDDKLLNAVCDVIDMICDHPGIARRARSSCVPPPGHRYGRSQCGRRPVTGSSCGGRAAR